MYIYDDNINCLVVIITKYAYKKDKKIKCELEISMKYGCKNAITVMSSLRG